MKNRKRETTPEKEQTNKESIRMLEGKEHYEYLKKLEANIIIQEEIESSWNN